MTLINIANQRNSLLKKAVRVGTTPAVLLGIFAASPAFAQEEDATFDGFRVEGLVGYDNIGVDFDDDVLDGGKRDQSGFLFGAAIGYDFQINEFVIGFEGDITESTAQKNYIESGTRPPLPTNPIVNTVTTNTDIESGGDISLSMRAGYVVNPAVLVYGKLGYSWHKLSIDGSGTDNGVPFTYNEKIELGGLRLGAGVEMNFSKSFYGKLEYQYSNYNNGDFDVNGANVNLDPIFTGIDVVSHHFMLGLGYRF